MGFFLGSRGKSDTDGVKGMVNRNIAKRVNDVIFLRENGRINIPRPFDVCFVFQRRIHFFHIKGLFFFNDCFVFLCGVFLIARSDDFACHASARKALIPIQNRDDSYGESLFGFV